MSKSKKKPPETETDYLILESSETYEVGVNCAAIMEIKPHLGPCYQKVIFADGSEKTIHDARRLVGKGR